MELDEGCMASALSHPHACTKKAPSCGECVRVLATCEPNPPPVAVYPNCMRRCLREGAGSCAHCVEVHAKCSFAS